MTRLIVSGLLTVVALWAQPAAVVCQTTAVPANVRAEGVSEQLGDIVMSCTGPAGRELTGNLSVLLNTTVTNRIVSGSGGLDAALTVNGALAGVAPTLSANNQLTWPGLTIRLDAAGKAEVRISNLRGDASFGGGPTLPPAFGPGGFFPNPVIANLSWSPGGLLNFTSSQFTVGSPERGLYATTLTTVVPSQAGSPLPENVTFTELLRVGTAFGTTRISEGGFGTFLPRQPQESQGTRVMIRFSGYPADARLFVPAAIAGSNAAVPTRAGDFGGTPSGGRYVGGSRTLALVRVLFTDAQGGGGNIATSLLGTGGEPLNAMTEVTLNNGSGIAVYEVVDSNPLERESAQIPVFVGVARSQSARSVTATLQVSFAPVSTTATTSPSAPVPRFRDTNAPTDCGIFIDCREFVPKLGAPPVNMDFRLIRGVGVELRTIPLSNEGGGLMPWSATVEYKRGNGWILLDRSFAMEPVLIRMTVRALTEMEPGLYEATLIIDAGLAGIARYPVRLEVLPIPTIPVVTRPAVTSVLHGATFETGPVARGSFVTLKGTNSGGANLAVTFDGRPARIVWSSNEQINALVPADLPGNTARVVVTAGGVESAPVMVDVVGANPGIFTPGIVNQDGGLNTPANPAPTGTFVQIYATGLLAPDGAGVVEAKLHDLVLTSLPYAGPAPGIPGLQQVNLRIPEGWPTMTTEVVLCTTSGGARQCSPPARIHMRQAQLLP